jgi:hypothetical protein
MAPAMVDASTSTADLLGHDLTHEVACARSVRKTPKEPKRPLAKLHAGCAVRVAFFVGPSGRRLKWFRGTVASFRVVGTRYANAAIEFEDGESYVDFGLFAHAYGRRVEAGWEVL